MDSDNDNDHLFNQHSVHKALTWCQGKRVWAVAFPGLYVEDRGVCLLAVHFCRTVDRVVGHPRPSLAGIGVPWVSLLGPTDVP